MKKIFSFLLLFLGISFAITAQNAEEKAVQSVIEQLFTGMQKHDSTMIRATFHPTARMQSIGINRKTNVMALTTEANIDGFVKQIGSLTANVQIEERVLSYEIRVDGNMATAWTPYELFVNGKSQHCGVDAFQLYKTENGWKIIALADTRRKCE
ncbi:nuclear transport factor 2 family protein [Arcicella rigui]|uniref:Nuclear transport factor 2 family protein n=1 Tax=Arcicella rigui TaxID=797020 RepID=A0ABU5QDY0_9BACT|nr:nuclear transport factor 2 family protein [Arcicella rigui]MEA5140833.1 nuclear transport factor 2 family protein [Arcicella rigui]